jgi:hypothetical protein
MDKVQKPINPEVKNICDPENLYEVLCFLRGLSSRMAAM